MSFYAYKDECHSIMVEASAIVTLAERKADYYCPGCTCKLRYRSGNSNKISPHFYRPPNSQHEKGCWMDNAGKDSGDIKEYDWSGFSLQGFFQTIQTVHTRSETRTRNTASGASRSLHKIKPTTIRQLYRICCENSDSTLLSDGLSVRNIFCGRKTAYYYKYYCSGLKIIETKYCRSSLCGGEQCILFSYPYSFDSSCDPNFYICVTVPNVNLYREINNELCGQSKPVLLFSYWRRHIVENCADNNWVCSTVFHKCQIVPL